MAPGLVLQVEALEGERVLLRRGDLVLEVGPRLAAVGRLDQRQHQQVDARGQRADQYREDRDGLQAGQERGHDAGARPVRVAVPVPRGVVVLVVELFGRGPHRRVRRGPGGSGAGGAGCGPAGDGGTPRGGSGGGRGLRRPGGARRRGWGRRGRGRRGGRRDVGLLLRLPVRGPLCHDSVQSSDCSHICPGPPRGRGGLLPSHRAARAISPGCRIRGLARGRGSSPRAGGVAGGIGPGGGPAGLRRTIRPTRPFGPTNPSISSRLSRRFPTGGPARRPKLLA